MTAGPRGPERIVTDTGGRALDHEWLRLCELLPEGSPEREAANSLRLDGESPVPYIEAYIDYLRRHAHGPPAVSPGAPAAARRAPTDAMIAAAYVAMWGKAPEYEAPMVTAERTDRVRAVLRAALAASKEHP